MEIKDFSWNVVTAKRFNNPLLPRSIRGIIVGKSIKNKSNIKCNFFETASDVPDPRDLNSEYKKRDDFRRFTFRKTK